MRALLIALLILAIGAGAASADLPSQATAFEKSRSAIGAVLPSMSFKDISAKDVALGDFRGRPLLISLIYTGCTDACPAMIENLYPAVKLAQETLGAGRFSVITIGFDAEHDSPDRMRSFARSRGVDLPDWHFLSADSGTIDKLSELIGFEILPSAGGFDHSAQITVADANGRIYRHVYGGAFSPQAIVEPLMDLVYGRERPLTSLDSLIGKVKLFCTVYNPNTGRYYFNYSLFIGIAIGLACLLLVLAWLIREFRRTAAPPEGHV